jgi:2'-5' RNA ligase
MSRVRTFVAVDVSPAIRSRLSALQDALGRAGVSARWASADSFHVTLVFLGDVEDRDLARLCRDVAAVCAEHDPFAMSLQGVGAFPTPERARVVWAGVDEGAAELIALNEALSSKLSEAGLYFGDVHRFNPHLTLGRVKHPGGVAAALAAKAGWAGGECRVEEVRVMASDLHHDGPVYSVLSTAALG